MSRRTHRDWVLRGEDHYAWKGDAARPETKRLRAQARYSLDGVTCEYEGCDAPATDRHHVSGDTGDNRRENLQFLCRRHHMLVDGRLEKLKTNAKIAQEKLRKPPRPCRICQRLTTRFRHGRCHTCAQYFHRHGEDRPDWMIRGETAPPKPCENCAKLDKRLARGLCRACYAYLRRTGRSRPKELAA